MCYFWSWSTLFQVTLFVMIHVIAFLSTDIIFKRRNTFAIFPSTQFNSLQLRKWKHPLGGFKFDFVISLNQVGHITELVSQIKCHQLIFMKRPFTIKPLFCHNTNSANVLYTLFWYMYYKLFLCQTHAYQSLACENVINTNFSELFSLKRIYVKYKNAILSLIVCFFHIWKD